MFDMLDIFGFDMLAIFFSPVFRAIGLLGSGDGEPYRFSGGYPAT